MTAKLQRVTPCLWFDHQAEEAARFYTSLFKNSNVGAISRYNGKVLTVNFTLEGQEFTALNGGPVFKFTEAVSFVVNCENQADIDGFWAKLSKGGQEVQCGWLKDKFGLSWQIVPTTLQGMLKDSERGDRVMKALLQMKKLDIAALERAYRAA